MNFDYREEKHGRNWWQNDEVLAADEQHSGRCYQQSGQFGCENDQGSMPRHSFFSSHHEADGRSCP